MDPKGQKFKFLRFKRNQHHRVVLVVLIPKIYYVSKMNSIWWSYHSLNIFPNRQKKSQRSKAVLLISTWHVEAPGHATWQPDLAFSGVIWTTKNMTCGIVRKWYVATQTWRGPVKTRHVAMTWWKVASSGCDTWQVGWLCSWVSSWLGRWLYTNWTVQWKITKWHVAQS